MFSGTICGGQGLDGGEQSCDGGSPSPPLGKTLLYSCVVLYAQGGTLQLKIRGGGWLDSLGSEILVGKDILGFLTNIDLDNSLEVPKMIHMDSYGDNSQ